ncbi:MAG: c-type cytochrome [Terriglobia bacterium]|jgi:mono/diheme cytochrome c family protein|nr:c-type cytochrome [Terriglobia bacterium]
MKRRSIGALAIAIVLGGAAVYGMVLIHHGFSARDEPSSIEAWTARRVRRLAIPSGARNLKDPVPRSPAAIREGMQHFADHCATCHANNGRGDTEMGRNLYPKAPDMKAAETQNLSDGELYYIIQNGIRMSGMPAWGKPGDLSDEESWKLVQFIRHLPSLTQKEESEMKRWNPLSPQEQKNQREEEDFLSGSETAAPHKH